MTAQSAKAKPAAKALFAAGCFWGVEQEFRDAEGVLATSVGYAGGMIDNPTYEQVCSGQTGHTETVEVEFDPNVIAYGDLLNLFWDMHDPTTLNRQGPDVGTQYRSAIFYLDEAQKITAEASLVTAQTRLSHPIVTEIAPAPAYWLAEDYHQQYIDKQRGRFAAL